MYLSSMEMSQLSTEDDSLDCGEGGGEKKQTGVRRPVFAGPF